VSPREANNACSPRMRCTGGAEVAIVESKGTSHATRAHGARRRPDIPPMRGYRVFVQHWPHAPKVTGTSDAKIPNPEAMQRIQVLASRARRQILKHLAATAALPPDSVVVSRRISRYWRWPPCLRMGIVNRS